MEVNRIYNMDCLEGMKQIPDGSVSLVCTDLPYGTTANKWDSVIPIDKLFEEWRRVLTDTGTILLFGSEPFSTKLRMAALDLYKYDWIWHKPYTTGFQHAKNMPLKDYEIISVFSKGVMNHKNLSGDRRMTYNPQGVTKVSKVKVARATKFGNTITRHDSQIGEYSVTEENYPRMVLDFDRDSDSFHPTQKPVALVSYLVKTYTDSGGQDLVLDCCMGSGTTAVACIKTNRNFIGFELNKDYYERACKRIEQVKLDTKTDLFGY